jgi:hypothetical protein
MLKTAFLSLARSVALPGLLPNRSRREERKNIFLEQRDSPPDSALPGVGGKERLSGGGETVEDF